jgi:hypothetical protein
MEVKETYGKNFAKRNCHKAFLWYLYQRDFDEYGQASWNENIIMYYTPIHTSESITSLSELRGYSYPAVYSPEFKFNWKFLVQLARVNWSFQNIKAQQFLVAWYKFVYYICEQTRIYSIYG